MKKKYHISFFLLIIFILSGCKEEIDLNTVDFEDILVVEATITNLHEQQLVKLSRTYPLEDSNVFIENNANVYINDSNGNTFQFHQINEEFYVSDEPFAALNEIEYQLFIETEDGKQFSSNQVKKESFTEITSLAPNLTTNSSGDEIIEIRVTSSNPTNEANFYRYEYEETYKIIAPDYSPFELILTPENPFNPAEEYDIEISLRNEEEKTCFTTVNSTGIHLLSINELNADFLDNQPVFTMPGNDSRIRERYSFLLKLFVISSESYNYYKIIDDLGSLGNFLSQNQPGYIQGNIHENNNPNNKVIGYFDIAHVSKERIYFNFNDFNLPFPPYFNDCNHVTFDYNDNAPSSIDEDPNERLLLYQYIEEGYQYVSSNNTVYVLTPPSCGDCTSISSNIEPDFWED